MTTSDPGWATDMAVIATTEHGPERAWWDGLDAGLGFDPPSGA